MAFTGSMPMRGGTITPDLGATLRHEWASKAPQAPEHLHDAASVLARHTLVLSGQGFPEEVARRTRREFSSRPNSC